MNVFSSWLQHPGAQHCAWHMVDSKYMFVDWIIILAQMSIWCENPLPISWLRELPSWEPLLWATTVSSSQYAVYLILTKPRGNTQSKLTVFFLTIISQANRTMFDLRVTNIYERNESFQHSSFLHYAVWYNLFPNIALVENPVFPKASHCISRLATKIHASSNYISIPLASSSGYEFYTRSYEEQISFYFFHVGTLESMLTLDSEVLNLES